MKLDHHHSQEEIIKAMVQALTLNLEIKAALQEPIRKAYGGEQLALIKQYNGLFIDPYGKKIKGCCS